MSEQLSVSIKSPCAEKWEGFTPTKDGGFCHSCQKNVTDFTKMTDEQVLLMIKNTSGKICGRLRSDQLKCYNTPKPPFTMPSLKWLQTSVVTLLLLLIEKYSIGATYPVKHKIESIRYTDLRQLNDTTINEHVVQGTVTDEDKIPLPGVNVVLKGSDIGTVTDINGYFIFPKKLQEGDVLVFSFIGLQTKEYSVPKNAPETIEIPMLSMLYDMMGELSIDEVYTGQPSGIVRLWQKVKAIF